IDVAHDEQHPSSAAFTIAFPSALPRTLAPGVHLDVDVTFDASALGRHLGWLAVESSAFEEPITWVPIVATAANACDLSVSPERILWRSAGTRTATITNNGASTCRVDRLDIATGAGFFAIDRAPTAPFLVGSGQSIAVVLEYLPSVLGQDVGVLEVEADG